MKDDRFGVEKLRLAIDQVAADLPPASRPAPFVVRMPAARRPTLAHPNVRAALAAGVVFLILGYPALLGLRGGRSAPGPADLHVLSLPREAATLRSSEGDEEIPKLDVDRSRPLVLLVEPDPRWIGAGDAADAEGYRLEIRRVDGDVALSVEMAGPELEELMALNEGIPLLIPAKRLAPGRYELRLTRAGDARGGGPGSMIFEILPP